MSLISAAKLYCRRTLAYHDNEIPRDGQIIRCNKEWKRANTKCPAVPWVGNFQCQNINIFFSKKIYGSNLSNSTRRLLRFEISKMLIAVLKINIHGVIWYSFRHPFVAYSAVGVAEWSTFVYNTVGMNDARVQLRQLTLHRHHLFARNRSGTTRPNIRHLQLPTI